MSKLRKRHGFTLPEVLVTVVILATITLSVTSVFIAASRTYRIGAVDQAAQRMASGALQRMIPDVRAGMLVTPGVGVNADTHIILTLPNRVWNAGTQRHDYELAEDATGALGLVAGDTVHYYRGTAEGSMSASGDRMWRMVVHADGTQGRTTCIATEVIDNPYSAAYGGAKPMFVYWPNEVLREAVEVTITVRIRQEAKEATRTARSEIALRNL